MNRITIPASDFDLEMTLNSGQVFHWEKHRGGFVGTIDNLALYVEQVGDTLKVHYGATSQPARGPRALPGVVARYFSLDHPLEEIRATFPNDPTMNAARDFCRGLRIIRQPRWECLATFICSSMKQVTHIRQISQALRRCYGQRRMICGIGTYDFPAPERLADTSERALRECALGYRARNLLATAQRVVSGEADLESWGQLTDETLRQRLMILPGVGAKVANCVMLFAYQRFKAFPVDVWIERVLRQHYFRRTRKVTSKKLADFAAKYFGPHGGYAQQYLFHHARSTRRKFAARGQLSAKS